MGDVGVMDQGKTEDGGGRIWGLAAAFAALFLVLGYHFARFQNVWIDESTQLLGSRQPLAAMFSFLSGRGPKLGVPEDRMPPVSYLVDHGCWAVGCSSDLSFRLLHLIIAAVAVVIVARLAATRFGIVGGVVAGALMALTPQMTGVGVEIRAYPMFVAVAALELALFWRLVEGPALTWRRLLPFWAVALIGIYVHFYGLVMAGAYCAALLAVKARSRRELLSVAGVGASLVLLSVGLVPFIAGARAASGAESAGGVGPARLVTYLLKLLAGPETLLVTPLAALYFVGLLALLALALWRMATRPGPMALRITQPAAGVAIALAVGIVITMAAGVVVKGFDPLKTSYSIWMWPAITLLAASGCAVDTHRWIGRAARGAALALVVALVGIAGVFASHAPWFVHGPERAIVAAVGSRPQSAIVYTTPDWGFGYFPVVYRLGIDFPQYVRMTDGRIQRITPGGGLSPAAVDPASLDRYRHLVVAAIDLDTYRELRQQLRGSAGERPVLAAPSPGRRMVEQHANPGLYSVRVARFDKDDR